MSHNDIHTDTDVLTDTGARTEANDPLCLSDSEGAALLAGAPWRRFAIIGGSTAAGIGDPVPGYETIPWGHRLARWLTAAHPDAVYHNTGRMGATIPEVAAEQFAPLVDFQPDLVHVTCGGNDLFRKNADLALVERDLDELCAAVAATGARLSLFTLADASTGPLLPLRPLFEAFTGSVRRVAARHDAILTEFWYHPARLRPDWLRADRIHLTMAGQAAVAAEMAKTYAAVTSTARR
ncbi:SGNH/GDSL hydrolase family protein [Nocardia crassostreae]|uniref:SGNH/GDSL hydrolase family protein n=1 Tax=Nocardia crassostreae TaxID=53428 RepID=UPI0008300113|nr:SGNH/GDSL hydrolase family protein [Nocardia crassostreae]